MTNIGLYRRYALAYLKDHPQISQDLTVMVRQLAPSPEGVPLEIYVFVKDKVWVNYEKIMSDIFDHLLAAIPTFDLEYIFLNIRAKSVGEVAKLKLLCPDDKETYANVELDLSKVEVQVDDKHSNEIQINDKIKMVMKYPTINSFDPTVDATKLKTEQLFDIIADTVYEIYDGETVHKGSDYSKEEMKKFIESLTSDHFAKIQQFFNTMPRLQHELEVENPKTKVKSKVVLSGLQSFFVSPSHMTT